MILKWCIGAACTFVAASIPLLASVNQADDLWHEQVEPVLDRYCFKCHGGVRQKSGLDLRSLENLLRGGDRGAAIVPGQPLESHLYQFVLPGGDPHMPPDEKKQLTGREIDALQSWIAALPGTNAVGLTASNQLGWVDGYLKAYRKLATPLWTPPEGGSPTGVIDEFIRRRWRDFNVEPSPVCDDRSFARRLYLDLAGRIPTWAELDAFLGDSRPDKRSQLVDALLEGPDYPRRMREVFDVVLMERRGVGVEQQRRDHDWFAFLEHAFRDNYSWDRIVRELIIARPTLAEDRGAVWYLFERQNNYQAMAEAIAPIAFGVQIGCAQCHNHPLTAEVEQRHYWGLVAALNRSKNVDCKTGAGLAESAIGGFISFANLKKESQPARMTFLNGCVVPEHQPGDGEKETDSPDLYRIPPPPEKEKAVQPAVPKFSRREALADAVTHENPQLARAFVNRLWALFLGRGLVHPVDQIDSRHRPSHPDLLNWLAGEFEEEGYDVKGLIREIVNSRVYQLDSRPSPNQVLPAACFARGPEKPLSAEQLYRSFLVAVGVQPGIDGKVGSHTEDELRRAFVAQFPEVFPGEYNASLQQATFLSNSPLVNDLLQQADAKTVDRLLAQISADERVTMAFGTVFGRLPDPDERATCRAVLESKTPEQGVRELLWALLTSAEFQMNH